MVRPVGPRRDAFLSFFLIFLIFLINWIYEAILFVIGRDSGDPTRQGRRREGANSKSSNRKISAGNAGKARLLHIGTLQTFVAPSWSK